MLELTLNDLGAKASSDGTTGLKVWWETPPGRKKSVFTVAWGDLVLIRPKLLWPKGVEPKKEPWWGTHAARVCYLEGLHKTVFQEIAQVPEVGALYEALPGKDECGLQWSRLTANKNKVVLTKLTAKDGQIYYVAKRSLQRVADALQTRPQDLDLRLYIVGDKWVILIYKHGLRAVTIAMSKSEVRD